MLIHINVYFSRKLRNIQENCIEFTLIKMDLIIKRDRRCLVSIICPSRFQKLSTLQKHVKSNITITSRALTDESKIKYFSVYLISQFRIFPNFCQTYQSTAIFQVSTMSVLFGSPSIRTFSPRTRQRSLCEVYRRAGSIALAVLFQ